jgi:predicted dehydrogenase
MPGPVAHPPVGIAILGCGRISGHHARAISRLPAHGRLVAVADHDTARAAALADAYDGVAVARDLDGLLARRDVDAVLVCTPNALHAGQTIRILESGRDVLVEKPFAENAADAERMADCAARTGRVLALGQTLRHTQPIRWLQDHRHDFGRLRAIEVSMLVRWNGPQAPWWKTRTRREGLILSLYAPHALDFVQLVMGGVDAEHVHAEVARWQSDWDAEDEAMILLRYPGGVLAQLHISYNQRFLVDRKTVHFDDAMLRVENGEWLWQDARCIVEPPDAGSGDPHRMGGRDLGHYFETQFREFAAAVRGEPHRSVLHEEGLRLTRLLDRVIASGLENAPRL